MLLLPNTRQINDPHGMVHPEDIEQKYGMSRAAIRPMSPSQQHPVQERTRSDILPEAIILT